MANGNELSYLAGTVAAIQKQLGPLWTAIFAQETWTAPTLLNSWINFGVPLNSAGYFKDGLGIIHLRGVVKDGIAATIFILPIGYRPANQEVFVIVSNNIIGRLDIKTDGSIYGQIYNNAYVSLDGITFRGA